MWGGKAAGYALGYPSSWAAYESHDRYRNFGVRYQRDTMRTGIHVDVVGDGHS
jgi:hypothetical protein